MVWAALWRWAHASPAGCVAPHHGAPSHPGGRADRLGQDAVGLSGGNRPVVQGPRTRRGNRQHYAGGLRFTAQGAGRRYCREPRTAAPGDRLDRQVDGVDRAHDSRRGTFGRHTAVTTGGHGEEASGVLGHYPRVALLDVHIEQGPLRLVYRRHPHRRRDSLART